MTGYVKYDKSHHSGGTPEQRVVNRLKNSGDVKNADHVVKSGDGARRTYHNIFNSANHVKPRDVRKDGA